MRLNYLSNAIGLILTYIGLVAFTPIIVALIFGEWSMILPFFASGIFSLFLGDILRRVVKNASDTNALNDLKKSEALVIASFSWVLFGLIASIPFLFSGFSFIDSLFESVSGITTTGASILKDYDISNSLLFWRSFTQWLGGMGIIVLFVAILPQFAVAGRQMFFAEAPGPTEDKLTPRIRNTASTIWIVYAVLTLLCGICLFLAGMKPFECLCNAMSTVSTGGFCPHPHSIYGYHSNLINWIIIVFMFLGGANFVLQSSVLSKHNLKLFWKNEEFRFYVKTILVLGFGLTFALYVGHNFGPVHALSAGFYQVLAMATSTGSVSENYDLWSYFAKSFLVLSIFLSSCSGSTGGGIKLTRWLLIFKYLKNELYKILHPNVVLSIKIDNKVVSPDVVRQTVFFAFCFFSILGISALLIVLSEHDLAIGISSAISSLGGVGPGFGAVGPMSSYSHMNVFSKLIFISNMLVGRLEIIPFVVLFHKEIWSLKK